MLENEEHSAGVSNNDDGDVESVEKTETTQATDWKSSFGDSAEYLRDFTEPKDLVIKLQDQAKKLSEYQAREKDMIPLDGSSKEQWAAFEARLGKPQEATEYLEAKSFKNLKEKGNKEDADVLAQMSHILGLSVNKANAMAQYLTDLDVDRRVQQEAKLDSFFRDQYGTNAQIVHDNVTNIIPRNELVNMQLENITKLASALSVEHKYPSYSKYHMESKEGLQASYQDDIRAYSRASSAEERDKLAQSMTEKLKAIKNKN